MRVEAGGAVMGGKAPGQPWLPSGERMSSRQLYALKSTQADRITFLKGLLMIVNPVTSIAAQRCWYRQVTCVLGPSSAGALLGPGPALWCWW